MTPSILTSLKVRTPIITIIIGEGGSGGAIALATADKVLMLENSIYSVISPEGCSSILWRSPEFVKQAAEILGGKGGGGRRDFAQAVGEDKKKIEEAFEALSKKIS